MNQNEFQIGTLICNKLKEDGRSVSWLAKMVHCERSGMHKILKKSSIDTALLLKIACVLKTNFFAYYSEMFQNIVEKKD